jgi:hypothetical protein
MNTEIILQESTQLTWPTLANKLLLELEVKWVNTNRIAEKLNEWLDAKTLNAKWDEMEDNKAQQKAFEYIMKLNWVELWSKWININLFNIPWPNEKMKY